MRDIHTQTLALFNSHPHKEDDKYSAEPHYISLVFSTHILTRRMTVTGADAIIYDGFSTHILTRRMTDENFRIQQYQYLFNSHPHKEDDLGLHTYRRHNMLFNSHPHKEDDSNFKQKHSV